MKRVEGVADFPTLGWAAVAWIETFLRHGPGDVVGEPIELDDEIVGFICACYRVFPRGHEREGRRVYNRAILSRPKGRSKSEIAGEITCWEALGECRFDHWAEAGETSWWGYEYEEGEPVGREIVSPFIRALATEASQAGNTYDNVRAMLAGDEILDAYGFKGDDIGRTRIFLPGGRGEIRPSTASGASKDGGKETFAVDDETHLAELDELRDMHAVVSRNLLKLKTAEPWMLETTTAYRPGMDSIAERAAEYARRLGGPEEQAAVGLLYDHREAPHVEDLKDTDEVVQALRVVYGPFARVMNLEGVALQALDPTKDASDFRRYWFNQSTRGTNSWFTEGELNAIFQNGVELEPGEPIVLGFDGSRTRDATFLVACTQDYRIVPLGGWWHDGSADWEVDENSVDEAVESAHDLYRVVLAYGDPPYWETNLAGWARRWKGVWRRWPTQGERRMADAVAATTTTCRSGGAQVKLDGDLGPLLFEHWSNAQRKYLTGAAALHAIRAGHTAPFVLQKDRPGSPNKIDGAPAAVLAHEAARDAHTKNLWRRAHRRRKAVMKGMAMS